MEELCGRVGAVEVGGDGEERRCKGEEEGREANGGDALSDVGRGARSQHGRCKTRRMLLWVSTTSTWTCRQISKCVAIGDEHLIAHL